MEDNLSKAEIIRLTRVEFDALLTTIRTIDPSVLTIPGVEGDWSIKDIMSHISAWRRLMIEWITDLLAGNKPNRPAPDESWEDLDDFNRSIYQSNLTIPIDEAMNEFVSAYADALAVVEGLSDADLLDSDRFAWRKGDPLWHMVAGNTWLHDQEHHETIRRWLGKKED